MKNLVLHLLHAPIARISIAHDCAVSTSPRIPTRAPLRKWSLIAEIERLCYTRTRRQVPSCRRSPLLPTAMGIRSSSFRETNHVPHLGIVPHCFSAEAASREAGAGATIGGKNPCQVPYRARSSPGRLPLALCVHLGIARRAHFPVPPPESAGVSDSRTCARIPAADDISWPYSQGYVESSGLVPAGGAVE